MNSKKAVGGKEQSSKNGHSDRYTFHEDMAIIKYITTNKRYLKASGIQIWKDAEKMQICPGRPYLSIKERFRKVLVKNLKQYDVDRDLVLKITQYMRASKKGKQSIRLKEFNHQ